MDEEQQPQPDANNALNVVDTEGNLVSIDPSQADAAYAAGYRPPNAQDIAHYQAVQQYGGATPQGALGIAEAAGRGAIPFGLFTAAELATGLTTRESIRGRQEALPEGAEPISETAGLIGSQFIPLVGQSNVLESAGAHAAGAFGLGAEGAGIASQIGSSAVKGATEMAILAGGDEASKALAQDPQQSMESAAAHIGLSTILGAFGGAAFGTVVPLWKAGPGKQLGNMLDALRMRYGVVDQAMADPINDIIEKTGMDVSPEVRAALYQDPTVGRAFQELYEGSTGSAQQLRDSVAAFKEGINQSVMDAFEKTPEEISDISNISNHKVGEDIQKKIADKIDELYKPISDVYGAVRKRLTGIPLNVAEKEELVNSIGLRSLELGFDKSPSSPQYKLIENAIKEIPETVSGISDLAQYKNNFKYNFSDPVEVQLAKKSIRNALMDTQATATQRALGEAAPDILGAYAGANQQYKVLNEIMEGLDSRINVPNWEGPETFQKSLMDMQPEKIASRVINKNDAGFLNTLQSNFPEAAESVRDYFKSQVFKGAQRGANDQLFNTRAILDNFRNQTPEVKDFLMSPEKQQQMEALRQVFNLQPKSMNLSGTAATIEARNKYLPSATMGAIATIRGADFQHALMAGVAGGIVKQMFREGKDAFNLSLLKYLGSAESMSSSGFKAMFDYSKAVIKGQAILQKSIKSIMQKGVDTIVDTPSDKDIERLKNRVAQLSQDKTKIIGMAPDLGHYMPEHMTASAMLASSAVDYLASQAPKPEMGLGLDQDIKPTKQEENDYNRTLEIAESPLSIFNHVKNGSLVPSDVQTIATIYPSLYENMKNKLQTQMIQAKQDGDIPPFHVRQSLSLLMGQPIDFSFTPQAIQGAQSSFIAQNAPPAPPVTKSKRNTSKLDKVAGNYRTADQSAQARQSKI